MNDFPRARWGVRSVVILSWKWNGRGALLERRGQTRSPEPASSPGGAGSSAGLWALEVRGGRGVLVSCLRRAGNPPLSGRLAPAALGLGRARSRRLEGRERPAPSSARAPWGPAPPWPGGALE